jgi:hypothetical protein
MRIVYFGTLPDGYIRTYYKIGAALVRYFTRLGYSILVYLVSSVSILIVFIMCPSALYSLDTNKLKQASFPELSRTMQQLIGHISTSN